MAKKTTAKSTTKKIPADLYWEWRCTLEELKVAKLNEKRLHLEQEIMNKEIENRKLKLALFKETVRAARSSVVSRSEDQEQIKQRIEEKLEMSLEDHVIDPYTYEVKPLNN